MKKTSELTGDAYPAEEPQAEYDRERLKRDYTDTSTTEDVAPVEYNWSMNSAFISVHPEAEHSELFDLMNHDDFDKPYAYGKLYIYHNWEATWEIQFSNMAFHLVEKRLKKYAKNKDWKMTGIMDSEGDIMKSSSYPGIGEINPGVKDWHNKEWGGTQQWDQNSQVDYYGLSDYTDETNPNDPSVCPECDEILPNYDAFRKHQLNEHVNPKKLPGTAPEPVVDLDQPLPADFNTLVMDKTVMRQSAWLQKMAQGKKPTIPGPIPFIYDVEEDKVYVGHPGERHSDIQGKFTPGGILEGVYDPKGNVQIRSHTDIPYTIKHMIQLWYSMHPELEVKGVYLLVGDQRYKLASSNIGHKVRNIAATDSAAWSAYEALKDQGDVYVVGGAVRDVVLGKTPKDIDMLVTGISVEDIIKTLSGLPGRVDITGKQFGVIRYKDDNHNEVEIALPRTEQSTGVGYKDFDVSFDPDLPIEDDLRRRDFTGNAMAVDLETGELIDPFRGSEDLKAGRLNLVNEQAFSEDPLRILRALSSVSRHELEPSPELYNQIGEHVDKLEALPAERIQGELDKILGGDDPVAAVRMGLDTGVFGVIIPELADTVDFDQKNKYHNLVLHDHLLSVLGNAASKSDNIDVRLAALLHDIGKVPSQWMDDEGWAHYYYDYKTGQGADHEDMGADMVRSILERLRYSNDRIDHIESLVRHHMFAPIDSDRRARKFLNRTGDLADDLLTLRWADNGGKGKGNATDTDIDYQRQLLENARQEMVTPKSPLVINGNDLIQAGIPAGPQMGAILKTLTDMVLDDPNVNTPEYLIPKAVELNNDPSRIANILDPIHEELDASIFSKPDRIDSDVHDHIIDWVTRQVYEAIVEGGWPDDPEDYVSLVLTGSLTTYQYSPDSDFDVSLFINAERFPDFVRADLIEIMVERLDGLEIPGTGHPLQCYVVPQDVSRYDLYQPGLRSAYDMDKKKWIVLPEPDRVRNVREEFPALVAYAKMVEDKMRLLLEYGRTENVTKLWDHLHERRRADTRAGGDFTPSNIVYKWLSNAGLFPAISEATGQRIAKND